VLKYSFMTFACPEYTLDQVIDSAARHGYDGVEPRAAEGHRHGVELDRTPAERLAIRKRFEDAGIAVACIATSVQLNKSDRKEWENMVCQAEAYCKLAADLGSKRVRVFGGRDPKTSDPSVAAARVIEGLAASADTAAKCGVFICLETHDYFSAGEDVAAICRAVNSPWIRATWDVQHPVTAGEDIGFTAPLLMPFVQHVHFHDTDRTGGRNDIVPIGEGQAPISEMLRVFRDSGYEGYVSGEWFYDHGPETDLAHYISALRTIERTL
jgi:sugar phosphate isomerase/epimerase